MQYTREGNCQNTVLINVSQEMADLKVAAASYEANVTVASVSEKMMKQAMSLGRNG